MDTRNINNLKNSSRLLSTEEASRFLNISIRQIRDLKKRGFIQFIQVGGKYGHIKFKVEWIENFINENKKKELK